MINMSYVYFLAKVTKLEGGSYNVESILKAITIVTDWCLRVGIALSGVALIIGFILYAVSDVDRKAHVKQRIIQTVFGIVGLILAISIVNIIISLF